MAAVAEAVEALREHVRVAKALLDRERDDLRQHRETMEELCMGVVKDIQAIGEREAQLTKHAEELADQSTHLACHEEDLSPLEDEVIQQGIALGVREALIGEVEANLVRREQAVERLADERVAITMKDLHERFELETLQVRDRLDEVEDGAARRAFDLEASLKVSRAAQDQAVRDTARLFTERENHLE